MALRGRRQAFGGSQSPSSLEWHSGARHPGSRENLFKELSSNRGVFKPSSQVDLGHVGSQNFSQCFNSVIHRKMPTVRESHKSVALETIVLRMLSVCD